MAGCQSRVLRPNRIELVDKRNGEHVTRASHWWHSQTRCPGLTRYVPRACRGRSPRQYGGLLPDAGGTMLQGPKTRALRQVAVVTVLDALRIIFESNCALVENFATYNEHVRLRWDASQATSDPGGLCGRGPQLRSM